MRDKNVDRLAQLLAPNARRDQPARPLIMRTAVVQSVSAPWNATVLFGGSTTPAGPIPCVASYNPVPGDVVQVLVASSASMLILGPPMPTPWQQTTAGTWIGAGGNPTGYTAQTRWVQNGKMVTFQATYTFGSTFGAGLYGWNLAIPGAIPVAGQVCHGYFDVKGDGSIRTTITGLMGTAAGINILRSIGNTTSIGHQSTSQAWAAGGLFTFCGSIEVL